MRTLAFIAFVLLNLQLEAQNLVPNPSFEDTVHCPFGPGMITSLENWIRVKGSIDVFNSCAEGDYSMPVNKHGDQQAYDGGAYIGIANWALSLNNAREFVGVSLTNPLEAQQRYLVKYHLSMADTVGYALRNFGALFTTSQPPNELSVLLGSEPQVVYEGAEFLDDQDGWMVIEGSFVAEGGEQFLTLGNFDDDANTDTLSISNEHAESSYYYLDNVSVVKDTTWHVGVEELETEFKVELYPNPNTGEFTVQLADNENNAELVIWDVSGKMVLCRKLVGGKNEVRSELNAGLYLYGVLVNGVLKRNGKMSVTEPR